MTTKHQYLIFLLMLTVFFMVFILSGSLLWHWQYLRLAIICFILCFPTILGQLLCIWKLSRLATYQKNRKI